MSKVIRILGNEDGFDFGNICSFITESYIGLWGYNEDCYFLVSKEDIEFCPIHLSESISSLISLVLNPVNTSFRLYLLLLIYSFITSLGFLFLTGLKLQFVPNNNLEDETAVTE